MSARPCPVCRKPAIADYRPFCSKRCADVDLQRWLSNSYAILTVEGEDDGQQTRTADDLD
jgi:hypothetical protein